MLTNTLDGSQLLSEHGCEPGSPCAVGYDPEPAFGKRRRPAPCTTLSFISNCRAASGAELCIGG